MREGGRRRGGVATRCRGRVARPPSLAGVRRVVAVVWGWSEELAGGGGYPWGHGRAQGGGRRGRVSGWGGVVDCRARGKSGVRCN